MHARSGVRQDSRDRCRAKRRPRRPRRRVARPRNDLRVIRASRGLREVPASKAMALALAGVARPMRLGVAGSGPAHLDRVPRGPVHLDPALLGQAPLGQAPLGREWFGPVRVSPAESGLLEHGRVLPEPVCLPRLRNAVSGRVPAQSRTMVGRAAGEGVASVRVVRAAGSPPVSARRTPR